MIVGFSFQKIAIEKKSNPNAKVSVKNNLDIKDCKEENLVLKDKKGANFNFRFTVDYEPNVAGIEILGNVIYHADDKTIQNIMATWKEHKKVKKEASVEVLNTILRRCNIKALELSQEFNLPPHIPMPKLNVKQEDPNQYIG